MARRSYRSKSHDDAPAPAALRTYLPPVIGRRPKADAVTTADYISSMLVELAAMAAESRLDMLTYLLHLARVEAEGTARGA